MLKKIIEKIIWIIQVIVITISLLLIYFVGFGVTLVFILLFNRKIFNIASSNRDTFWIEADGYDLDMNDGLRQS